MSIEVISVPDRRRIHVRFVPVCVVLLLAVLAFAGDALVRSYTYYSQIIDARLAGGYLTSRPGLYAAPRVLQVGQKFSVEKLVATLRRAGYLESTASGVWSGSFTANDAAVEIRPNGNRVRVVRVTFAGEQIAELAGDGVALESFTLEPEILSNDLSSKAGKREVLAYNEIPSILVQAILSIEDRRFFEHSGVDVNGLARAFIRNVSDERMGQGGSTVTQQLVKNTYLSQEKTLRRKYAEAMLSVALEQRLSKQDIFALYCNEIYL